MSRWRVIIIYHCKVPRVGRGPESLGPGSRDCCWGGEVWGSDLCVEGDVEISTATTAGGGAPVAS